jgi:hypothetical protein
MRILIGAGAIAAALLAAMPAEAALPPKYQRIAELRAVLDRVAEVLATDEEIDRVDYVRTDLFRVQAGRCHVDVAIVSLPTPPGIVGARRFEARAGRRICGGGGRRR